MINAVSKHIGRRGGAMLSLAVVMLAIGWTNITATPETIQHTIFSTVPIIVLGLWWLIPGVLLFVAGLFDPNSRWDGLALFSSYLATSLWGAAYVASSFLYGNQPIGVSFRTAAIFWGFSAIIFIISGWPDPAPPVDLHERSRKP